MSQGGVINSKGGGGGGSNIQTLTGNTGGPVPPTGNNVNIVGSGPFSVIGNPGTSTLTISPGTGGYPITPYVVGPVGQAGYQTVQAGINAAHAAGVGSVYVQDGTYNENLTLYDGIQVVGVASFRSSEGATINGTHTPPTSGVFLFNNLILKSATNIFSSAAAGTARLVVADCNTQVTNGYVYNLPNWTGGLEFWNTDTTGSTNDGGVNNTAGATIFAYSAGIGAGTGNSLISSGSFASSQSNFYCPIDFVTGATFNIYDATFSNPLTFSNNSTGIISNFSLTTGTSQAITMSSTANVYINDGIINSTAVTVVGGAGTGTLFEGQITFLGNKLTATTTAVNYSAQVGMIAPLVVGPSGNYTHIQDAVNACKVGSSFFTFGAHIIFIQPGFYTENIDITGFPFPANIHFRATAINSSSSIDGVSIEGTITIPTSGRLLIESINLAPPFGPAITSSGVGSDFQLILRNCNGLVADPSGNYLINLPNFNSGCKIIIEGYNESDSATNDAGINNTGGALVSILNSPNFANTAALTSCILSGITLIDDSKINCPINFVTGATFTCNNSTFVNTTTLSNNSTGSFENCIFNTGSSAAITMSSSGNVSLTSGYVNSSASPLIAGAGAGIVSIEGVNFPNGYSISGSLTLDYPTTLTSGNFNFPLTTSTEGQFKQNGNAIFHSFGTTSGGDPQNIFLGTSSGNFTMGAGAINNTGIGIFTLHALTSGSGNTALGNSALLNVNSGVGNLGLSEGALFNLTTGSNNIAVGNDAGLNYMSSEASNIVIGNLGTTSESNVIRIGTQGSSANQQNECFIAGIVGVTVANPTSVVINSSTGQLGVTNGSLMGWTDESGAFAAASGNGYFTTAAATPTLPAAPSQGDTISFIVDNAGTTTITANTGQKIRIGTALSASAGTAASNAQGNTVTLVYRAADATWISDSVIGTWTVT